MANNISTLSIGAVIDTSGIDRGLNRIQNSVSRFGGRVGGGGGGGGGVPGAFGGGGGGGALGFNFADILAVASPFAAMATGRHLTAGMLKTAYNRFNQLSASAESIPKPKAPIVSPHKLPMGFRGDPVAQTAMRVLGEMSANNFSISRSNYFDANTIRNLPRGPRRGFGPPPPPPDIPMVAGGSFRGAGVAAGIGAIGYGAYNLTANWNKYYKKGFQNAAGYYAPGSQLAAGINARVALMDLYQSTPEQSMMARFANAASGGSVKRSKFENAMDFISTTYNAIHNVENLGAGTGIAFQLMYGDIAGAIKTGEAWRENINNQYKGWSVRSYGSSAEIKQWSKEQERLRKIEQRNAI